MPPGKIIPIAPFLRVENVMESMQCSRAMAYSHMRRAIGRRPGERGQLRVPLPVWERYVARLFDPDYKPSEKAATNTSVSPVPITRPRRRRTGKK